MRVKPEDIPYGYAVLRCECCKNDIGLFKPQDLKVPLIATMFLPPRKGYPHPFRFLPQYSHTMSWEAATCPCCDRRPFNTRDHVFTPKGLFKVGDTFIPHRETQEERNQKAIEEEWAKAEEAGKTLEQKNQDKINAEFQTQEPTTEPTPPKEQKFVCEGCGKEYSHASGLSRHRSECPKIRKGKR